MLRDAECGIAMLHHPSIPDPSGLGRLLPLYRRHAMAEPSDKEMLRLPLTATTFFSSLLHSDMVTAASRFIGTLFYLFAIYFTSISAPAYND